MAIALAFAVCVVVGAVYVARQLALPGLYRRNIVVDFFQRRFHWMKG